MYRSASSINYGLQRPDEDEYEDWEPAREPMPKLEEVRQRIASVQAEVLQRGKVPLSGNIIMACHTLPYVCNLRESLKGSRSLPIEIQPGDNRTMPQGLHSLTAGVKTVAPPVEYPESREIGSAALSALMGPAVKGPPPVHRLSRPPSPAAHSTAAPATQVNGVGHGAGLTNNEPKFNHSAFPIQEPAVKGPSLRKHVSWLLQPRRGHAAMNAGLRSLADRPMTLVAWPGDLRNPDGEPMGNNDLTNEQKKALDEGLSRLAGTEVGHDSVANVESTEGEKPHNGIKCAPVWLDDKDSSLHYEGYCKGYLWPLFHYMPLSEHQDATYERAAWQAYQRVNEAFARKITDIYKPGDLIFIQDYHLLLVPAMLKKMIPECHIGLFLHSPFPSSEFFRCLPRREAILTGMLGTDLLCFQTFSYGRHFVSSCIRVMGYESVHNGIEANGTTTAITHCPIGIDADRIDLDRQVPGVAPKIKALRGLYSGKKIIVARDKLDPTKGVLPKLRAFAEFLGRYPNWRGRVVLIQVTTPSSTDSGPLASKVSELVDATNATYGTLHFQPIHHYHQTIERDEYFALLSVADLAIITSVRDGMNTTSMEYAICQQTHTPDLGGSNPLILSEFTGVTGSMKTAIKVNPWDLGGVATAIDQCLSMSAEEKKARHQQLYSRVKSHSSAVWAHTLILQLLECLLVDNSAEIVSPLNLQALLCQYTRADNGRLILLDYDGTLSPIVKNPSDAIPPPGLCEALETLCKDPRNKVYIISGRDGVFLQEHLGHIKNLGMSAEHGCFLREPGAQEWMDLTEDIDMSWMNDVEEIFKYYEARTLGAFVEKKVSSVTWHYRNADPDFGLFQARECQALLESMQERLPIDVLVGKKNLEVRPAHTNKGEIVKRLLYSSPDVGFALCAGDDKTDEDMFRALRVLINTCSDNQQARIAPPQSMALFPGMLGRAASISGSRSRASSVEPAERSPRPPRRRFSGASGVSSTPGSAFSPKLEPVQSGLDPKAMFAVVIDENERRRTLADHRVSDPLAFIKVLGEMAQASAASTCE